VRANSHRSSSASKVDGRANFRVRSGRREATAGLARTPARADAPRLCAPTRSSTQAPGSGTARCHSRRTATVVCARRRGPIDGHSPHRRTSTRPEARGIIDAHQARSVPFHHQRTCAEADLLRSADGPGELVPLAPTHRLSPMPCLKVAAQPPQGQQAKPGSCSWPTPERRVLSWTGDAVKPPPGGYSPVN
jgi:hypothetical protein